MMKSSGTAAVGFLVVTVLWRLVIGGNPKLVWCRWKTPCLLEANFPIVDDVVIHWERWFPSKLLVHNFDYGKDQLQEQDQHFRGRTSLFKENIPKGNASLLITDVLVADEGTYMCYVGTLTRQWKSFIKLNVVAAVTSIHFRLDDEDQLICSSDGIFPQPELRWSTEPALPDALRNSSQVQQETQTQLYNITGSLALAGDAHPDLKYICDINTVSSQRITWRKTTNRSTALQMLDCSILVGLILGLIVDLQGAMLFYQKMRANRSTSPEKLDLSMFSLALALIVLLQAATLVSQKMRANRSTSLQTSYWWIVGLVVALIVLELALTVLVLVAMLVYRKRRGKATKSSSRDPEEETELNSVKGVKVRRATNFLPEATTDRLDPRDPRPHPSTH